MSEQHTPEPWKQGITLATTQTRQWTTEHIKENDRRERRMVFSSFSPIDGGRSRRLVAICEHDEDARRIVACVNACSGLPYLRLVEGKPISETFNLLESELARLRRINEMLVEALEKAIEEGHPRYCHAVKGPENESWLIEADCDCWIKEARQALAAAKEE